MTYAQVMTASPGGRENGKLYVYEGSWDFPGNGKCDGQKFAVCLGDFNFVFGQLLDHIFNMYLLIFCGGAYATKLLSRGRLGG